MSRNVVMVTSNDDNPYQFSLTLDSSRTKIKVSAKHRSNKDTYYGEFTNESLKKIGFNHKLKGFYNRMKNAIDSKAPEEIRSYYNISNNKMIMILEEMSKFDDESTKYSVSLKKLKTKATSITPRSPQISSLSQSNSNNNKELKEAMDKQIGFIIKQVKEKFQAEKIQRQQLEDRIETLETLCTKLMKKIVKLTNEKKEKDLMQNMDLFGAKDDSKLSSPNMSSQSSMTGASSAQLNEEVESKLNSMQNTVDIIEKKWGNELHVINQKMDDIRPKLVRLKTRRDFASETAFIEYIINKLEQWDANKFGPILVRVMSNATGKAKHFIGYVGEPQKWNTSICKVQWFGLGKKLPEAVEWKALDVFLPLSSFYYPDCPHARAHGSRRANDSVKQL